MGIKIVFCILFGYAIGGINPSYIIGRLRGFDIREKGSGNAGASNAVITMGKAVGMFSALFDIAKAAVSFLVAPLLFRNLAFASVIAGVACIFGHIFPVYMKFKGGKGLACIGGVILGIDWRYFLIFLALEVILALLVDYICIIPITASVILPFYYGILGRDGFNILLHGEAGWWGALILATASVGILFRHAENIRRIAAGKEMHLSFLWKKDKESEITRVTKGNDD